MKIKDKLDNSKMATNKNNKVAIIKTAYDPEKKLKDASLAALVGEIDEVLPEIKKVQTKQWFERMKERAGFLCRTRIIDEILKNATNNGYPWVAIEDIQDAWAAALDHESRVIEGQKILKCLSEGYFASREESLKPHWKYALEKELMDDMNIEYLRREKGKKDVDGCLARQASRSRSDVLKRIERKGKRIHKYIVSKQAPNKKDRERTIECLYDADEDEDDEVCAPKAYFVRETVTKEKNKGKKQSNPSDVKFYGLTLDPNKMVMLAVMMFKTDLLDASNVLLFLFLM